MTRTSEARVEGTSIAKSDEQLPIVLAKRNFGYWFQLGAFGLSFVILAVPVLLVKYSGQSYSVPNKPHWIVAALFLDKETATYSLSKFQFYVWTAVSVFGYVYLFAARCLIQGIWEFIEIPKSLPGLVLISAATGAAAQFVTTQRGPKGAGEEHPAAFGAAAETLGSCEWRVPSAESRFRAGALGTRHSLRKGNNRLPDVYS